jgi:hypothetical protein
MFQHLLKNKIQLSDGKKYFLYFMVGFILILSVIYLYNNYVIDKSYEKIEILSKKIDSLNAQILVKENQRLELEIEVKNKKIEIQEIVVTKYIRPKINSPDSSFQYLKRILK